MEKRLRRYDWHRLTVPSDPFTPSLVAWRMAGILDYLKIFRLTFPYPNMKHETRSIQGTLASISAQGPSSATRSRYGCCFGKQLKSVGSSIIPDAPDVWIIYLQVKMATWTRRNAGTYSNLMEHLGIRHCRTRSTLRHCSPVAVPARYVTHIWATNNNSIPSNNLNILYLIC